ncbi:transcription initiation factor TFIID subunit 9 [Pectinophora gossypiella]|uniref:Transcription initiation factor TFIID subunit 9 n=1 Tax=Pectinophora gossypiella TaxID=13191 RepID=A0A1E1W4L9_PECGO|nr:transcription initiation factor TFIID subunit 9 [Pectinophora gossypiella]
MSEKDKTKANTQTKHIPKDSQVIMSIMKEVGITDYEPRVVNQMLEFTYRYVASILDDARVFANHAKKKTIDLEDVRLAVQMQLDKSFTSPPPREVLLEIARTKNVNPLPLIKPHCGLRLPPDRYCLAACNYRLKPATKKIVKTTIASTPTIKTVTTPKPSVSQQNVVVKRPPQGPIPKPGTPMAPKPVLKFTSGSKVVAKPAVRVTAGPSSQVKMEVDEQGGMKRKREDDDYDM